MLTNEQRADVGELMVRPGAASMRGGDHEPVSTCIVDTLAYVAHFCDRAGLDPCRIFDAAIAGYRGDGEDGPRAARCLPDTPPLRSTGEYTFGPILAALRDSRLDAKTDGEGRTLGSLTVAALLRSAIDELMAFDRLVDRHDLGIDTDFARGYAGSIGSRITVALEHAEQAAHTLAGSEA